MEKKEKEKDGEGDVTADKFAALVEHLERRAVNNAFHVLTEDFEKAPMKVGGVAIERPDESDLIHCDGSLKRNTAFTTRVRLIADCADVTSAQSSIISEIANLNGTKYVQECAIALAQPRYVRVANAVAAVRIAEVMHRRYSSFAKFFTDEATKAFRDLWQQYQKQLQKNAAYVKAYTVLLLEGSLSGVFRDGALFVAALIQLIKADMQQDSGFTNLEIVVMLIKKGGEKLLAIAPPASKTVFASLKKNRPDLFETFGKSLAKEQREKGQKIVRSYYDALCKAVCDECRKLHSLERGSVASLTGKGFVSDERLRDTKISKETLEFLHKNADTIAEYTGYPPVELPQLKDEFDGKFDEQSFTVVRLLQTQEQDRANSVLSEIAAANGIWGDETTRRFYEVLPDLSRVDAVMLKEDGVDKDVTKAPESLMEAAIKSMEDGTVDASSSSSAETDFEAECTVEPEPVRSNLTIEELMDKPATNITMLLEKLPYCYNCDLADQVAEEFYYMNNKERRDKLMEALLMLPWKRPDLVPYMARIVAILGKHFKVFQSTIVQRLINEFTRLYYRKNLLTVAPRIRNARYLCELTKFGVCPRNVLTHCLNKCIKEFSPSNMEVICCILDSCGRFLYRSPDTMPFMDNFLSRLKKVKAQNIDPDNYLSMMLDNAIYSCNPPCVSADSAKATRKEDKLTLLQQYVRYLLFQALTESTKYKVSRIIRALPRSKEMTVFLADCFLHGHKARYDALGALAYVLSSVCVSRSGLSVRVIDGLFEGVLAGLEQNNPLMQQRRLFHVKFFAELFVKLVVTTEQLRDMMYMILVYGHDEQSTKNGTADIIDPPTNCFRIRLICALLSVTGGKRIPNKNLFRTMFQKYIRTKQEIPLDLLDTLEEIFRNCLPGGKPLYNSRVDLEVPENKEEEEIVSDEEESFEDDERLSDDEDEDEDDEYDDDDDDEDDDDSEDDDDDDSDDDDDEDDDDSDDDDDDDEDDDESEEGLSDDEVVDEMDDEFDAALSQMMEVKSSIGSAPRPQGKPIDITIPIDVSEQAPKIVTQNGSQGIQFSLLGNRQRKTVISLVVPEEDRLARYMEDMKARQDQEKEQVKNLVLSAVKGQAEQERHELQQQQPPKSSRQITLGDYVQ